MSYFKVYLPSFNPHNVFFKIANLISYKTTTNMSKNNGRCVGLLEGKENINILNNLKARYNISSKVFVYKSSKRKFIVEIFKYSYLRELKLSC